MFEKLQQMEQNYSILQEKLNQPETYDDPQDGHPFEPRAEGAGRSGEHLPDVGRLPPELRRAGRAAAQR